MVHICVHNINICPFSLLLFASKFLKCAAYYCFFDFLPTPLLTLRNLNAAPLQSTKTKLPSSRSLASSSLPNSKTYLVLKLLNIFASFDTVDRSLLLSSLHNKSFHCSVLIWFSAFLSNCMFNLH